MITEQIREVDRRKTQFNILLIEDNITDALLVQSHVEKMSDFNLQTVEILSQALECLSSQNYDVILLDLNLPDALGLEALVKLRHFTRKVPIVVLTGINDRELGIMALQRGAQDYLIKGIDNNRMMKSIRYAIERALVHDPNGSTINQFAFDNNKSGTNSTTISITTSEKRAKQHQLLTERELEVLRLLGQGFRNGEIAAHLVISVTTVKTHMCNILQKLAVADRTNALIEAQRRGLI